MPAQLAMGIALLGTDALAVLFARRRLRLWLYSALEFTQAYLLETGVSAPARLTVIPCLWLSGYFTADRNRLLAVLWGGLTAPLAAAVCWLCGALAAGTVLLGAAQGLLYLILAVQEGTRTLGTDGRRHERFSRYAPFSGSAVKALGQCARRTFLTDTGARLLSAGNLQDRPELTREKEEAMKAVLARY